MARLHGTIRNLRREETAASEDTVEVEGVAVSRGSRVRLRPRLEGADAQDMFLHGRIGEVCGIFRDLEDKTYLAVTLEDDPAAELYWWHGRFLYFRPDEVSPLLGSSVKRTSE